MESSFIDVIDGVILNSSNQDQMMPSWVANAGYKQLDPENIAPIRVKLAALEHLKQVSRQRLRGKFEPSDVKDALQHDLFPTIQARYPTRRQSNDGEPIYVKPEMLSNADWLWNINRLRTEASTKLQHADALRQWGIEHGLDIQAAAA